jgi:hypothetical protein
MFSPNRNKIMELWLVDINPELIEAWKKEVNG